MHKFFISEGTSVDWEVSLQLSSAGPSNRMPPGWYFTRAGSEIWHSTMAASLYGNVGINGLDEWSVDKLGWYKSPKSFKYHGDPGFHNGQVSLRTMQQIRDAFQINTASCVNNVNTFQVRPKEFANKMQFKSIFSSVIWHRGQALFWTRLDFLPGFIFEHLAQNPRFDNVT